MQNIVELAATKKLRLSSEEKEILSERKQVLENSFAILGEINTDNVEPLVSVLQEKNVLREDVTAKMISREELLKNAPEQYDGYFQVPKTLD
ncbi:MAG: Asp-tRNA(Asn)/Glu-tRNA(Gln) amidotransferase subunit GatC [Lachnospiraceae bacterium]|nr:Asp-tRNA(Asn)/Glu-tRNA(Gln) amidotransferase subunit GatC [Lachnospiraceae bacterium]